MQGQHLNSLAPHELLDRLNEALVAERQAVADYTAHAQACERLDIREALEALCDVEREHTSRLVERIQALGSVPTKEDREPKQPEGALLHWLSEDLAAEQWAIVEYARLVAGILDDDETSNLMAELLRDEIRHANWLKGALRRLRPAG